MTGRLKTYIMSQKLIMSKSQSRQRVLVVAYVFPPVGGAGVQRVTKFVKYLPEFGWDATVLTAENPSVPLYDESLLADIPPQTVIVKASTLEPGYALKRMVSANSSAGACDGSGHATGPQGLLNAATRFVKRTL